MHEGLTRHEKNSEKSPWPLVACVTLVGFLLPYLIYGISQISSGERFFESRGGMVLVLCPPYFLSTVFDHTVSSERIRNVAGMSVANAVLYLFGGLVLAVLFRDVRKRKAVKENGIKK
jgi:hypothetical protein